MECSVTLAAHPVRSSSLSRHISETVQTVPSLTSVLGPEARSLTALWGGVGGVPGDRKHMRGCWCSQEQTWRVWLAVGRFRVCPGGVT